MNCCINSTPPSCQKISLAEEVHPENASTINAIFQRINKFHLHGCNIPGPLNCFSIPYEFLSTCKALIYAQTTGNEEALQDVLLKLSGMTPFILYSILTMSQVILQIGLFIGVFNASQRSDIIPKELLVTAVAGIAFCGFEGGRNILNIVKQQKFISQISDKREFPLNYWAQFSPSERKAFQEKSLETLKFLNPYIEKVSETTIDLAQKTFKDPRKCEHFLESFQEAKLAQLSKRVMPWFAEKIAKELPLIFKKINSDDLILQKEGILEGRALLKDITCQAQKQKIRQVISLIAIGMSLTGCISLLVLSAPYWSWVPLGFFLLSFLVYLVNGLFYYGMLFHAGWDFNANECIPDWIRARLPSTGSKAEI